MMRSIFLTLTLVAMATAFSPATMRPAMVVRPGRASATYSELVLRMSEKEETEAEAKAAPPTSGTFYDDEVGEQGVGVGDPGSPRDKLSQYGLYSRSSRLRR